MKSEVRLKIADIIVEMKSDFPIERMSKVEWKIQKIELYNRCIYKGDKPSHIRIDVEMVSDLQDISKAKPLFIHHHPEDGRENWRLVKEGSAYMLKCTYDAKEQLMVVNEDFDRAIVYLKPKLDGAWVWHYTNLVFDFVQSLLINYMAKNSLGVVTHSAGIKELDGRGLLFNGKSGAGKSTTAKLWYEHSDATVINDDRIIVRKIGGKYIIYGSPWHGDFSYYTSREVESAPLEKVFFIHHSPENTVERISSVESFSLLYSNIFPTFWDKDCLEKTASFCQALIENTCCYSLGFRNDAAVVGFVRGL